MMDEIVKARVEDGVVVEAFLISNIPFPNDTYRADLEYWLTAPTEVGIGWLYNGEIFTPPTE
jgi:hypothetical protein